MADKQTKTSTQRYVENNNMEAHIIVFNISLCTYCNGRQTD